MKNILALIFVFTSLKLFAQNTFISSQADSLNFCGYFKEELKLREKLAKKSNQLNTDDYEYSSLIFQNEEKLYFHELYNLNFPSELVVLSACNTGVGSLLNGEGLMSIARALHYAGVKSSINSLWQVPDKETADLMTYFYQNLADKMPKDKALSEAKRIFIQKNPSKTHPYYWAGFVLNGNTKPISEQSNLIYVLRGVLGISVFGLLFFRKRLQ